MNRASSILAGALAGLFAGLLFATLHAFIIVPIWDRMAMGLAFGITAGIAAGWAYAESAPQPSNVRSGVVFGMMLFAAVLPVTVTDATLRASGFREAQRTLSDVISVVLAVSGGAAVAWLRTRRVRAMIALAAAALFLTFAMGGPVPVARNVRAAEIYLAVLVASVFAGAVLGFLEPRLRGISASIFGSRTPE